MTSVIDGDGFLAISCVWINLGCQCTLIVVYAPQDLQKKKKLWQDMSNAIINNTFISIVLGDFNEVRSEERSGTSFCQNGANHFNNFIYQSDLCDLAMGGRRFTRMSKDCSKLSKIDRILVSSHFVAKWPNAQLTAIPREFSDHCPLVLKSAVIDFV